MGIICSILQIRKLRSKVVQYLNLSRITQISGRDKMQTQDRVGPKSLSLPNTRLLPSSLHSGPVQEPVSADMATSPGPLTHPPGLV